MYLTSIIASAEHEEPMQSRSLSCGRGGIYVAGRAPTDLFGEYHNEGPGDAFLVKYDRQGTRAWTRLVGNAGSEDAKDVTVGDHGNLFVVGHTDADLAGETHNGGNADGFLLRRTQ